MSEVKVKKDLTASTFGDMYYDSSNNRLVVAPYESNSSNQVTNYVTHEENAVHIVEEVDEFSQLNLERSDAYE